MLSFHPWGHGLVLKGVGDMSSCLEDEVDIVGEREIDDVVEETHVRAPLSSMWSPLQSVMSF